MRPPNTMLAMLVLLAPLAARAAIAADPAPTPAAVVLEDGTTQDQWRLDNGLQVMTRHIPDAAATAVTVAYRMGTDDDPAGHEGLADLLAEVAFTAATGEAPERTREELDRLRPIGWNVAVNPTLTLLTEMCRSDQMAGVLHQVADRMSGVQVTTSSLRDATASVKADLARRYAMQVDQALHYKVRLAAFGAGEDVATRYATGAGLEAITGAEVRDRLAERYVPANAVLAIVGDLSGIDLRRFTAAEFGGLAAGEVTPRSAPRPFTPGSRTWSQAHVSHRIPAIGILAPALSDSSHPAFLITAMIIGGYCGDAWGAPAAPRSSNYRYSLLDDPDIVRFYPPVGPPQGPVNQLAETAGHLRPERLPVGAVEGVREVAAWLAGGLLPRTLWNVAKADAALLADLSTSMASRPHFGDEFFWAGYRKRLERVGPDAFLPWRNYLARTENMSLLVLAPPGEKRDDASSP